MVLGLSFLQGLGVYWEVLKQSKVPKHCITAKLTKIART